MKMLSLFGSTVVDRSIPVSVFVADIVGIVSAAVIVVITAITVVSATFTTVIVARVILFYSIV